MRVFRPSGLFRKLFPEVTFRLGTNKKQICLTFDDGPDPSSTPFILDILAEFSIKAVFFCNGNKAEQNQGLMNAIRSAGHITGNHGYLHADGWKTHYKKYIRNVSKADDVTSDKLFRPPYGHLTFLQYRNLKKRYNIIMWDLMPYDFDKSFGTGNCMWILRTQTRPGSVIVLHDTHKSFAKDILREFIEFALDEGYEFVLPSPA
ncbi:MAG TPA: polysaccharide deacetylase family protein [Bacteroidales bacterium]|nr:polysaccharide deacetylase family protein [Bacteroidales bacterium]